MLRDLRLVLLAGLVLAQAHAQATPVLRLVPEFTWVTMCKPFDVDLVLTGMDTDDPRQTLGSFDLTFHYDPEQFVFVPAITSFGGGLGDTSNSGQARGLVDTTELGTVRLIETSLLESSATDCVHCQGPFLQDLQRGGFVLARVGVHNFTHWHSRLADFSLDPMASELRDVRGELITGYAIANVTVQIDEPPSLSLVLLAMAASIGGATVRPGRPTRRGAGR